MAFLNKLSILLKVGTKGTYEWDDTKRRANLHKHGLDFADMVSFDWDTAYVTLMDHPSEERWIALGFLNLILCFVVYTERGDHIRLISLRKATRKERDAYGKN